jgi:hypothetical protein
MTPLNGKLLPIFAQKKSPTTLATSYVWCPIGSFAPTNASWGPSLNKLSFILWRSETRAAASRVSFRFSKYDAEAVPHAFSVYLSSLINSFDHDEGRASRT